MDTVSTARAMGKVMVSTSKQSIFTAIGSCLTEEQGAKLIALQESMSHIQWRAGDLVNEIYQQVIANRLEVTMMDVCEYVSGQVYGEFSATTLRIYSAISKFYPIHIRSTINDVIPYGVFRYAATFGDDWRRVFDFAEQFLANFGRPPYLRELRDHFNPTTSLLAQLTPPPENFIKPESPEAHLIEGNIPEFEQALYPDDLSTTLSKLAIQIPPRLENETNPTRKMLLAQLVLLAKEFLQTFSTP